MKCNIKQAIILLKKGYVIGIPTDTVYGLAVLEAFEHKIYALKGRNRNKKLITMIANSETLPVDAKLKREFVKNWPGKVTYVFEEEGKLNSYRKTSEPNVQKLLHESKLRIKTTSANKSGEPACLNREDFMKVFPKVPLLEERFISPKGNVPSKIIVYNRTKMIRIR